MSKGLAYLIGAAILAASVGALAVVGCHLFGRPACGLIP